MINKNLIDTALQLHGRVERATERARSADEALAKTLEAMDRDTFIAYLTKLRDESLKRLNK